MPSTYGVLTTYGLSALAAAVSGNYVPPVYLVLENNGSTVQTAANAGVTSIQTALPVHLAGDSELVLGVGLGTQEVVSFSAATGAGPTTYTLTTPTTQAHAAGDPVCRVPLTADGMGQVQNEIAYDPTNSPGQRLQSYGGYSSGPGTWVLQFFLTGIEASAFLMMVGLSDSPVIGQGNLHAHATLGTNHVFNPVSGGVDIEIDIPISIAAQ